MTKRLETIYCEMQRHKMTLVLRGPNSLHQQVSPGLPSPIAQPGDIKESGESAREDSPLSVDWLLTAGLAL